MTFCHNFSILVIKLFRNNGVKTFENKKGISFCFRIFIYFLLQVQQ